MIGFTDATLAQCPPLRPGDLVSCPTCGARHPIEASEAGTLLYYRCSDGYYYLAGVDGRLVMRVGADLKGRAE